MAGLDLCRPVRIARPTDRLEDVARFYRDGLGLPVIATFEVQAGYRCVTLGLPDRSSHLDFSHHEEGSDCPAPNRENLLVLYIPDAEDLTRLRDRMFQMGYEAVAPENPHWLDKAVTFEDPDGWRVVLCNTQGV
ncbi:MAG TPA: VOC family protein [Rhodospirillales bacterium]|nr:VOC family protein [Rhodospirillales bacterium]HJO69692.1 VOC family protein [Rhodospirillales bacterium]